MALLLMHLPLAGAESFAVATYSLKKYVVTPTGNRPVKSAAARAKIRESIHAAKADVIALQEMGTTNALLELRASLKSEGLDYPYWEHTGGFDTNIHLAVLSRFPFRTRHEPERENFLLQGRRFRVSRGFAELEVRVNARYTFTLLVAHLKSKRPVPGADEQVLREQEARLLREIIDTRLKANPDANLIVVGDLNDSYDSKPVRTIKGRGRSALMDTRPAERNGDDQAKPVAPHPSRRITWTYHYGKQDAYERNDYILVSQGMAPEWEESGTFVVSLPNWGIGSD
ncbi:MAG: endonuclease/exonuclease/phosphatase family protein, partial [Pedosphaera parvula]|nr:endonuclease/exonuclease/phosphatase family protein [Pedosphaera parvula]